MSERLYSRACPVCASSINVTLDTQSEDIVMSCDQIEPLYKDCEKIVNAYRRVKKLPLSWEIKFKPRGILAARDILAAFPPMPQIVDNAIAMLEWLQSQGGQWDLGTAAGKIPAFLQYQRIVKEAAKRPRCGICAEQFDGQGNRCGRHEGM